MQEQGRKSKHFNLKPLVVVTRRTTKVTLPYKEAPSRP